MSLSNDVVQLVHDRLLKAQSRSQSARLDTLDDLGSLAETLSTVAERCRTVMQPPKPGDAGYGTTTAMKQLENLLAWDHFWDHVKINPVPVEGTLLFRAHHQPISDPPLSFVPLARERLLSERYRRANSVDVFLHTMNEHLGKMDLARKGKRLKPSKSTSTSPDLDWTLHLTGQKAKQTREGSDWVGLVVFDLQKLSETPGVTVIKVSEVLDFVRNSPYSNSIDRQYRIWASNCHEYLLMGRNIPSGVVQLIPWSRLESMPIIHPWFTTWYTLKLYCDFVQEKMYTLPVREHEEACQMVVESSKILTGERSSEVKYVRQIVQLILRPMVRFWAIRLNDLNEDLSSRCGMIIDAGTGLAERLSQVSV